MEIIFEHLGSHETHGRMVRGELLSLTDMLTVAVEGQKLSFPLSEIREVIEIANGCVVYTAEETIDETGPDARSSKARSCQ